MRSLNDRNIYYGLRSGNIAEIILKSDPFALAFINYVMLLNAIFYFLQEEVRFVNSFIKEFYFTYQFTLFFLVLIQH